MDSIPDLIAEGFGMAFTVWVIVWGITIPIRLIAHWLGLGDTNMNGGR